MVEDPVLVPTVFVSGLIGKGGEHIARLQEQSGGLIQATDEEQVGASGAPCRVVTFGGQGGGAAAARAPGTCV
eukprot:gene50804-10702_t